MTEETRRIWCQCPKCGRKWKYTAIEEAVMNQTGHCHECAEIEGEEPDGDDAA